MVYGSRVGLLTSTFPRGNPLLKHFLHLFQRAAFELGKNENSPQDTEESEASVYKAYSSSEAGILIVEQIRKRKARKKVAEVLHAPCHEASLVSKSGVRYFGW